MKRFLLFGVLLGSFFYSFATAKSWVGGSGNWSDFTKWAPAGTPVNGDDITINTGGTISITIDNAGPFLLNSLLISNNTTVTFDCTGTRNFTLSSTSALMPGLKIDAGSTLTLDGSNAGTNNSTLKINGAAGVIGTINGTLIFSSSGGSRGTDNSIHLDTNEGASNYGIVTVNNGGMIIVQANAGNTQTSLIPVPNIIMKNGSVYQTSRNGGSFPVGTWETTSLAKATSVGDNGPSFNGDVYGNLEYNCPLLSNIVFFNKDISFNDVNLINTNRTDAGGEIRVKTSNSAGLWTMTINGNLTIGANARLVTTALNVTDGNGGKIHVKGNLINNGTIKADGSSSTINELELNGIANQNVSVTDSLYGPIDFIMNNSAGATLLSPVTLPYNLQLTSGTIKTTATNIITMVAGRSYSGGSTTSFIEGPMKKIGDTGFLFPVGVGSIYAPIGIINVSGESVTDEFTAEYKRTNPRGVHGIVVQSGMDHTSYVEYWSLNKTGAAVKKVSLRVNTTSFCKEITSTFVSRYNSSFWTAESTDLSDYAPFPPYQTGTLTTTNGISAFGDFTLITNLIYAVNPLPINLISFDATKLTSSRSSLAWELAACCSSTAKFEAQRAGKNKNFITIGTIGGSEINRLYSYTDNGLQTGINYYRLKMTDEAGTVTYSRTIVVMNGVNGLLLTSLIPTVVTNTAALTVGSSAAQKMDIVIMDMQGRVVQKQNYSAASGNTTIQLSTERLSAGVYQVFGISSEGKTNWIRFVKQ